jgi:hypothetical protein
MHALAIVIDDYVETELPARVASSQDSLMQAAATAMKGSLLQTHSKSVVVVHPDSPMLETKQLSYIPRTLAPIILHNSPKIR